MGELFTMIITDFKGDEWKIIKDHPVILECLKDNSLIEIIDIDDKIHKMTFSKVVKSLLMKLKTNTDFIGMMMI